jgi:hypothetical protein
VIGRDIKLEVKASHTFRNSLLPSFNLRPGLRNCIAKRSFKTRRMRGACAGWWKPRDDEVRRGIWFVLASTLHVKMRTISRRKRHASASANSQNDYFPLVKRDY